MGNGRARTIGAKAHWFHPIAPRCVRATRWRRDASDPGRPGIVRAEGKVEMMWHPQTKGRATEKTNIDLEPCAVGADISELGTEQPSLGLAIQAQWRSGRGRNDPGEAGRVAENVAAPGRIPEDRRTALLQEHVWVQLNKGTKSVIEIGPNCEATRHSGRGLEAGAGHLGQISEYGPFADSECIDDLRDRQSLFSELGRPGGL